MQWTNYHGHCDYCDGQGKIEDYVLKAIELNMAAIGISSHSPVPFPTDWNMPRHRFDDYCAEIDQLKAKYRGQIQLYKALEVDFIRDMMSVKTPYIRSANLDYTVGSVHFVGSFDHGEHWAIDSPAPLFKQGFESIFHNDIKQLATTYYHLQNKMLETATPTILGHLDKVKMYNKSLVNFDEEAVWYKSLINETIALAVEKGVIIEINTKTIFRDNHLFPGEESFKLLKDLGAKITINSDCHHPDKLTLGFEEVASILLKHGINHLFELIDGKWQPIALTNKGLLFETASRQ